jgi:hypothetical protein
MFAKKKRKGREEKPRSVKTCVPCEIIAFLVVIFFTAMFAKKKRKGREEKT